MRTTTVWMVFVIGLAGLCKPALCGRAAFNIALKFDEHRETRSEEKTEAERRSYLSASGPKCCKCAKNVDGQALYFCSKSGTCDKCKLFGGKTKAKKIAPCRACKKRRSNANYACRVAFENKIRTSRLKTDVLARADKQAELARKKQNSEDDEDETGSMGARTRLDSENNDDADWDFGSMGARTRLGSKNSDDEEAHNEDETGSMGARTMPDSENNDDTDWDDEDDAGSMGARTMPDSENNDAADWDFGSMGAKTRLGSKNSDDEEAHNEDETGSMGARTMPDSENNDDADWDDESETGSINQLGRDGAMEARRWLRAK